MGATKSAASFTSKGDDDDDDCCCGNKGGDGDGDVRGDGGWDWALWTWDDGCVVCNNDGCGVWGVCNEFLWFTVNEREKWKE